MSQLNTVQFPSNNLWDFFRQFLNIIFVKRKTHCSFSVKYICFVSHLSDEKTKCIIYHIYFEIATFLKTSVYIYIYIYIYNCYRERGRTNLSKKKYIHTVKILKNDKKFNKKTFRSVTFISCSASE